MSAKQQGSSGLRVEGQEGAAGVLSGVDSDPGTQDQLPHSNLYVKGLPSSHLDPESVRRLFEDYGDVESVRVVKYERARSTRAFAFVRMKDTAAAAAALGLYGSQLTGSVLSVSLADADSRDRPEKTGPEPTPCHTVYIKHVPVHYGPQELSQLFAPFGPVVHARLLQDSAKCSYNTRTAAALVQMETVEAAAAAVAALHNQQLPGVPTLVVARFADPARTRHPNPPSSSGRAGGAGSISSASSSLAGAGPDRQNSGTTGVTTPTQATASGNGMLACGSYSSMDAPQGAVGAPAAAAASRDAGGGYVADVNRHGARRGSRRPGLCPQQEVADAQPVRGGQSSSGSSKGQQAGYTPGVTRHHPLRPLLPRSPDEGPRASFAQLSSQSSHHQQPQYVQHWPHPQREQQHGHWDQEQQQEAGHRVALQEVEWEEHWPHAGQGQGAAGARPPATWAPATSRGLVCAPPPPPPPLPAAAYLVPRFMPPGVPLPAPQMHYWVPVAAHYPPSAAEGSPQHTGSPLEGVARSSSGHSRHLSSARPGRATAASAAVVAAAAGRMQGVQQQTQRQQQPSSERVAAGMQGPMQEWPLPPESAAVSAEPHGAAEHCMVQPAWQGDAQGQAPTATYRAAPGIPAARIARGRAEGRAMERPGAADSGSDSAVQRHPHRGPVASRGASSSCRSNQRSLPHPPPSEDQAVAAGVRGAAAAWAHGQPGSVPQAQEAPNLEEEEDEEQLGDGGATVEVHNLPEYATSLLLYQTFGPLGAILAAHVRTNLYGTCTGTGYVTFRSPHDAAQAVSRSGQLLGPCPSPLRVVRCSGVCPDLYGSVHA